MNVYRTLKAHNKSENWKPIKKSEILIFFTSNMYMCSPLKRNTIKS